jgi:hypothetical protein
LVQKLAVFQERAAEHPFLDRAQLTKRAVAAAVCDGCPGLEAEDEIN